MKQETTEREAPMPGQRIILFVLEGFAVLIALLCLCIGVGIWYLQKGPIEVDRLTPLFERAFDQNTMGLTFQIGHTRLSWEGIDHPVSVVLSDVQIAGEQKIQIGSVESISVGLSPQGLLMARLRPSRLIVKKPHIYMIRKENGHLLLDFSQRQSVEPSGGSSSGTEVLKTVLQSLAAPINRKSLLHDLSLFEIEEAVVTFSDRQYGQIWHSPGLNVALERSVGGFEGDIDFQVQMDEAHTTEIKGTVRYNLSNTLIPQQGGETFLDFELKELPLEKVIKRFPSVQSYLGQTKSVVNAGLKLSFLNNLDLSYVKFQTSFDEGMLDLGEWLEEPVPFKSLTVNGEYDDQTGVARFEETMIRKDDLDIILDGQWNLNETENNLSLQARIDELSVDKLVSLWPQKVALNARTWVDQFIHRGQIQSVAFDLKGNWLYGQDSSPKLDDVVGTFDIHSFDVEYIESLPHATNIKGKAKVTPEGLFFDLESGEVETLKFGQTKLSISDFDAEIESLSLDMTGLSGSVNNLISILNQEPFGYIDAINQKPENFSGQLSEGILKMTFPLYNTLALEQVDFTSQAQLQEFVLKNAVGEQALENGKLLVDVNTEKLTVTGVGTLASYIALESFTWHEYFSGDNQAPQTEIFIKSLIDASQSEGLPNSIKTLVDGKVPADLVYKKLYSQEETLNLKADLKEAALDFGEYLNFTKEKNVPAEISANIVLKNQVIQRVEDFKIHSDAVQLLVAGKVDFDEKGQLSSLTVPIFQAGANDFTLRAKQDETGYQALIKGQSLDLGSHFDDNQEKEDQAKAEKPSDKKDDIKAFKVGIDLKKVYTANDLFFNDMRVYFERAKGGRINKVEWDSVFSEKDIPTPGTLRLRLKPNPETNLQTLSVVSNNAGGALSRLGVGERLRGGSLKIVAKEKKEKPNVLAGQILIKDMTVVKAPTLARIINALSVEGLQELFDKERKFKFDRIETDVEWNQADPHNHIIQFRDGQTKSASLGLTFEGNVFASEDKLDIGGTVVPASNFNKFLGNLLTLGTGDALFAATYTIKGPSGDPAVVVNPLAALAPGFLRKLFFEKKFDDQSLQSSDDEKPINPIDRFGEFN